MTLNQSLSGTALEVAFGQLYLNATFQVQVSKILYFGYILSNPDTFAVIDNSHCFNHIPTEANPKQIYSRRRWWGAMSQACKKISGKTFESLKTLLRHGVGQVELLDRTPLAPDIGDCPTFAVPQSNVSAYKVVLGPLTLKLALPWFFKVVLQLQEAPVYRIYLFSRGWFYLKLMEGSLDYIEVKRGEQVTVHLALQVLRKTFRLSELSFSKILRTNFPLFSKFRKSPSMTFLEALFRRAPMIVRPTPPSIMMRLSFVSIWRWISSFQEIIRGFFECINKTFGCVVPCFGGVYMPHNYTICTNASQYDYGVIGACFEDGMASLKTSCKITDINYGPLHVTSGQNTTRCPIVQTDICRFDHAIDSFHCQCPLQGTLTLYQSLWPFIFRLEIILPPQLIRTQEYLKFSANALQVSNPWQPDYRLWLRDILPPNAPISDKSWCSFLLSRAALAAILVSILASLYSR